MGRLIQSISLAVWNGGYVNQRFVPFTYRMLRRNAIAAPPEDRSTFNHIIQPGLANLLGCQDPMAMLFKSSDKGKCPRDIIINDHTWQSKLLVRIVINWAQLFDDLLMRPVLEWST